MDREKENKLFKCKSLNEFLTMFFGYGINEQLSIFDESMTIKAGTFLYRARKDDGKTNLYDFNQWTMPPAEYVKQGRLNEKNKPVLYVASNEYLCGREIGLKDGDKYYLVKYKCEKDFSVGTLFCRHSVINTILHRIVMAVKTENLTENERIILQKYHIGEYKISIQEILKDNLSVFYIDRLIKNLYDVTNKIGHLVLYNNENGIRYSSVFEPIELSGVNTILTLDGEDHGNYALTEQGAFL
ncbi:MAG: hypothetical protein HDQ98_09505 [Lachnospiraceae bacterium]|nr:hypothetical protein [Lachnospiraceae bacterium]